MSIAVPYGHIGILLPLKITLCHSLMVWIYCGDLFWQFTLFERDYRTFAHSLFLYNTCYLWLFFATKKDVISNLNLNVKVSIVYHCFYPSYPKWIPHRMRYEPYKHTEWIPRWNDVSTWNPRGVFVGVVVCDLHVDIYGFRLVFDN